MFWLVINPGTPDEQRFRFSVTRADIDDAVDYGRAQASDPPERQLTDAAYHMVLEARVCTVEQVCDQPWVLLHRNRIIAGNAAAYRVTERHL